jgi:hypothetical protein
MAADVTHSTTCSSYDPAARACHLSGATCPHAARQDFAACPDATFVARVSMPPDQFHVLLNANHQPALGTLQIVRCRRPEFHHHAAGVHVNVILETVGDQALLTAAWQLDGSVEYHCPTTDVRFLWRNGRFIPL